MNRQAISDDVIVVESLKKTFKTGFLQRKSVNAITNVSLHVQRGTAFGFLGPNGAGKTTTIKVLTGLIFPTGGIATVLGHSPIDVSMHRRVGYLPENPSFPEHLTGLEWLTFASRLNGMVGADAMRKVRASLDLVKIGHAANLQIRRYSKGMVQRLGIAQALVHEPELVILDEPMSGLDPIGRRDMKDLILSLRGQGKTIFFSTHIISDVEEICDNVAIVVNGTVVRSGQVHDLLAGEAREIEVVAINLPEGFPGLNGRLTSGSVSLLAKNDLEAKGLVQSIWESGGRVISLKAKKYGLETVFLDEVAKQPPTRRMEEV